MLLRGAEEEIDDTQARLMLRKPPLLVEEHKEEVLLRELIGDRNSYSHKLLYADDYRSYNQKISHQIYFRQVIFFLRFKFNYCKENSSKLSTGPAR